MNLPKWVSKDNLPHWVRRRAIRTKVVRFRKDKYPWPAGVRLVGTNTNRPLPDSDPHFVFESPAQRIEDGDFLELHPITGQLVLLPQNDYSTFIQPDASTADFDLLLTLQRIQDGCAMLEATIDNEPKRLSVLLRRDLKAITAMMYNEIDVSLRQYAELFPGSRDRYFPSRD